MIFQLATLFIFRKPKNPPKKLRLLYKSLLKLKQTYYYVYLNNLYKKEKQEEVKREQALFILIEIGINVNFITEMLTK